MCRINFWFCFILVCLLICVAQCSEIIAIGDLHGDYDRMIEIFNRLNFTIDNNILKLPQNISIIQTGDVLDRGPRGLDIANFFLLNNLINPKVDMLVGNHEQMNLAGQFHYVNKKEFTNQYFNAMLDNDSLVRNFILTRQTIKKVDNILYVHAGIPPFLLELEKSISKDLNITEYINNINKMVGIGLKNAYNYPVGASMYPKILGEDGPLWYRDFSNGINCGDLYRVLDFFGANHMVVGHQIQTNIKVKCYEPIKKMSIICIDVGMSRAYGGKSYEFVKITDGKIMNIYHKDKIEKIDLEFNKFI